MSSLGSGAGDYGLPEFDKGNAVPSQTVQRTNHSTTSAKDRPLGYVELAVKNLARQNVDDIEYPFQSLGKLDRQDPIRLHGDTYKGKLHYVAEFIPAYNLRGLAFEARETEMEGNMRASSESGEDAASGDATSETDGGDVPEGITIRATKPKPEVDVEAKVNGNGNAHQRTRSIHDSASVKTSASKKTNRTNQTKGTAPDVPPAVPDQNGLEMSREDLFKQRWLAFPRVSTRPRMLILLYFPRIGRSYCGSYIWCSS